MCSGQSKGELQAAFNVSLADGGPDAGYEDDEQDAGLGASVSFPNIPKLHQAKPNKTIQNHHSNKGFLCEHRFMGHICLLMLGPLVSFSC